MRVCGVFNIQETRGFSAICSGSEQASSSRLSSSSQKVPGTTRNMSNYDEGKKTFRGLTSHRRVLFFSPSKLVKSFLSSSLPCSRAELIETDAYFLEISRYIHLNPVRADIVEQPLDYIWSSYGLYLGVDQNTVLTTTIAASIVTTDKILNYFLNRNPLLYQKYVES